MEEQRQKSWFARNWGWVFGGGCLSVIIIAVIVVGGLIYKVSDTIKESEPYKYAFSEAINNDSVINFLGTPIETNGMGSTSYNYSNGDTSAELVIPIKGPKDEANIVVYAKKISNEWSYRKLYVEVDDETEVINLIDQN